MRAGRGGGSHSFHDLSQEELKALAFASGNLLIADIPPHTTFGIDMCSWDVRQSDTSVGGIKLIPAGLHLVYTTATTQIGSHNIEKGRDGEREDAGATSSAMPSGYFFFNEVDENVKVGADTNAYCGPIEVLRWDRVDELLREYVEGRCKEVERRMEEEKSGEGGSEEREEKEGRKEDEKVKAKEDRDRLVRACRSLQLDRLLTPYPIETIELWHHLTHFISSSVLKRCGLLRGKPFCASEEGALYDFVREGNKGKEKDDEGEKEGCDVRAAGRDQVKLDRLRREGRGRIGGGVKGDIPPLFANPFRSRPQHGDKEEEEKGKKRGEDEVGAPASISAVTAYALDRSYALADMLNLDFGDGRARGGALHSSSSLYDKKEKRGEDRSTSGSKRGGVELEQSERELLGEYQLSFVMLLLLASERALEHWKALLEVFSGCRRALNERPVFFSLLLQCTMAHLQCVPGDFFDTDMTEGNVISRTLPKLLTAIREEVDGKSGEGHNRVLANASELAQLLTTRYSITVPGFHPSSKGEGRGGEVDEKGEGRGSGDDDEDENEDELSDTEYSDEYLVGGGGVKGEANAGEKESLPRLHESKGGYTSASSSANLVEDEDLPALVEGGEELGLTPEEIRALLEQAALE